MGIGESFYGKKTRIIIILYRHFITRAIIVLKLMESSGITILLLGIAYRRYRRRFAVYIDTR